MQTQKLVNTINNVISAQRNLVLLKDNNMQVYEDQKAQMSKEIADLRVLVQNNAAQTSRMTEIEHLSLKLKDVLDQKIATFKDNFAMPTLSDYEDVVQVRGDLFRLADEVSNEEYKVLRVRERLVSSRISITR